MCDDQRASLDGIATPFGWTMRSLLQKIGGVPEETIQHVSSTVCQLLDGFACIPGQTGRPRGLLRMVWMPQARINDVHFYLTLFDAGPVVGSTRTFPIYHALLQTLGTTHRTDWEEKHWQRLEKPARDDVTSSLSEECWKAVDRWEDQMQQRQPWRKKERPARSRMQDLLRWILANALPAEYGNRAARQAQMAAWRGGRTRGWSWRSTAGATRCGND